jgi:hypothetical protein
MRAWKASEHTLANHIDQRQLARYGIQNHCAKRSSCGSLGRQIVQLCRAYRKATDAKHSLPHR